MAEQNFSIINTTVADILIDDLGLVLGASETLNITEQFFYGEVCNSNSLKVLVTAGTVSINNGTLLTPTEAINFLTRENKFDVLQNHYTKTELQTGGQATINWGNITNAPSFGSPTWLDAVNFIVKEVSVTEPVGVKGESYVNTSSNTYFVHDGSTQVASGSVSIGDRVIVLSNANQSIFTYDGTSQILTDDPILDNSGILVDNDGDGRQSQYVYNTTTKVQSKIGDVDFGPHMDGGINKHNTTEIRNVNVLPNLAAMIDDSLSLVLVNIDSVIGTIISDVSDINTDISNISTNMAAIDSRLTTAEGTIVSLSMSVGTLQSDVSTLQSDVFTLQNDVNTLQNNVGMLQSDVGTLQNDISTINNNITTIEGNISGLQTLITQHSTDISNLQAGLSAEIQNRIDGDANLQSQIDALNTTVNNITGTLSDVMVMDGRVYGRDTVRSKQLGSSESIVFQKSNSAKNTYLRTGDVASNVTGVRLYKSMTLIAATAEISASGTCEFHIRKNNSSTDLAVLTISGSTGVTNTAFNIDFDASDVLEIFCTCAGVTVSNPIVRLTIVENGGSLLG